MTWSTYIGSLGRRHGLSRFKWWTAHRDKIEAVLRGRYEIICLGHAPPPIQDAIRAIWFADPRPQWTSPERRGRYYEAFVRLVETVERRAKRDTPRGTEAKESA